MVPRHSCHPITVVLLFLTAVKVARQLPVCERSVAREEYLPRVLLQTPAVNWLLPICKAL